LVWQSLPYGWEGFDMSGKAGSTYGNGFVMSGNFFCYMNNCSPEWQPHGQQCLAWRMSVRGKSGRANSAFSYCTEKSRDFSIPTFEERILTRIVRRPVDDPRAGRLHAGVRAFP
jgi:hypothetical protein